MPQYMSQTGGRVVNRAPAPSSQIRAVHNKAGAPNVDIELDGRKVLQNVSYKTKSDYLNITPGYHQLAIILPGQNGKDTVLANVNFDLEGGKRYTAIVHGAGSAIDILILEDDVPCPQPGQAYVRAIHGAGDVAAAGIKGVDIVVNGKTKVIDNLQYGQHTVFVPVDAVPTNISAHVHSDTGIAKPVLLLSVKPESQGVYSLIATGNPSDKNYPLGFVITDDKKASCVVHHLI